MEPIRAGEAAGGTASAGPNAASGHRPPLAGSQGANPAGSDPKVTADARTIAEPDMGAGSQKAAAQRPGKPIEAGRGAKGKEPRKRERARKGGAADPFPAPFPPRLAQAAGSPLNPAGRR